MGIEQFFSSIEENNITNLKSNFTYKLQKKLDCRNLYIDFNSIIHVTSTTILSDINYFLYQVINDSYKNNIKLKALIELYEIELDIDSDLEYSKLVSYFTKEQIDNIVCKKVLEYVKNILANFIDSKNLEHFYIAIDGVPHKSKIMEQKKRRYMGTIIEELKTKIFHKHESELMKHKVRFLYEQNKFKWSKMNISPGTKFMERLEKELISKEFIKSNKEICPKIKKYNFSGTNEFGEGEKKIIDFIYDTKPTGSICIFSPDSDMTLLCLLLSNSFDNISIIRHNQQQNNYDIVNIDSLKKNLFNYVLDLNKIKGSNFGVEQDKVINDIVFILTIFGNDFLPKLESFNVRHDFNPIIDKYALLLREKKKYILDDGINQDMFVYLLDVLHKNEGKQLQKLYMSSQYQNYEKLKKIMGATNDNFTEAINNFLFKLRHLNHSIRTTKIDIDKLIVDEGEFIERLIKLTRFKLGSYHKLNPQDHLEFLTDYVEYYKTHSKFPEVQVTLKRYSRSLKTTHYRTKLEHTLDKIDPELTITAYDEEIFKLDNMLDEYAVKLNASSINLGYVSVDPKTFLWKTEKIDKSVKKYYYDFFGINDIDVKTSDMKNLINDYIEGLVWVYNYYFTVNTKEKPSVWYYKYGHAPLITQIYQFMKLQEDGYISGIDTKKYTVEVEKYFSPKEHLMYVSPTSLHQYIIPEEYKNKTKTSININDIIEDIWDNTTSDEIDCRGVLFLNKCNINKLHVNDDIMAQYTNDKKYIEYLRN